MVNSKFKITHADLIFLLNNDALENKMIKFQREETGEKSWGHSKWLKAKK